MQRSIGNRVRVFGLALATLIGCGTVGFAAIEGWSLWDSLYMTVITMSTVGFGETYPLSPWGRMFTVWLILFSIVCMSCWTATLTSLIIEGNLTGVFARRRTKRMAAKLQSHTIICGSGRMAQAILDQLMRHQHQVIVIDNNKEALEFIRTRFPRVLIVEQAPTNELALASANVLAAACVIAATDSEFDNLLVSMTCRELGVKIKLFAVSHETAIASRMAKVGVDEVVCPYQLGGERIAHLMQSSAPASSSNPLPVWDAPIGNLGGSEESALG